MEILYIVITLAFWIFFISRFPVGAVFIPVLALLAFWKTAVSYAYDYFGFTTVKWVLAHWDSHMAIIDYVSMALAFLLDIVLISVCQIVIFFAWIYSWF